MIIVSKEQLNLLAIVLLISKRFITAFKKNDSKPHIWILSLNFGVSRRKSQSQKKLAKAITHFTTQFRSKHLAHFKNLNSFNIVKNILLQHSEKSYSIHKFSRQHVFGCSQKKHLHCTSSRRPRTAFLKHLEDKCLYIPVYLRNEIVF